MGRKPNPRPGCISIGDDGKWTMTDIGLMHVLELSSLGSGITEIADYLRISNDWLHQRLNLEHEKFDPAIYDVYSQGLGEFKKRLRSAQQTLGDVNAQMAIHLGKHYLGQVEKSQIDITKTIQIVGTLPDYAQTPEAWRAQFGPQQAQRQVDAASRSCNVIDAEVIVDEAE